MRPLTALFLHLTDDILAAVIDGLGVHHHAAAAAVGVVVHLLLPVQGVVPDLMAVGFDIASLCGPTQDAFVQHPLAHLREQGRHIHTHHTWSPFSASLNMPGMGLTSTLRSSMQIFTRKGLTAGNRAVEPSGQVTV